MVAGRLQEKNGFYYIVLSTRTRRANAASAVDRHRAARQGQQSAPKMLAETRKGLHDSQGSGVRTQPRYGIQRLYAVLAENDAHSRNGNYLLVLLLQCGKHIIPYFEPLGVTLAGLQPRQIQSFICTKRKR